MANCFFFFCGNLLLSWRRANRRPFFWRRRSAIGGDGGGGDGGGGGGGGVRPMAGDWKVAADVRNRSQVGPSGRRGAAALFIGRRKTKEERAAAAAAGLRRRRTAEPLRRPFAIAGFFLSFFLSFVRCRFFSFTFCRFYTERERERERNVAVAGGNANHRRPLPLPRRRFLFFFLFDVLRRLGFFLLSLLLLLAVGNFVCGRPSARSSSAMRRTSTTPRRRRRRPGSSRPKRPGRGGRRDASLFMHRSFIFVAFFFSLPLCDLAVTRRNRSMEAEDWRFLLPSSWLLLPLVLLLLSSRKREGRDGDHPARWRGGDFLGRHTSFRATLRLSTEPLPGRTRALPDAPPVRASSSSSSSSSCSSCSSSCSPSSSSAQ